MIKNCLNCRYSMVGSRQKPCRPCIKNKMYPIKLKYWEAKNNED